MERSRETPAEAPAVRKMLSGSEGYPSRSAMQYTQSSMSLIRS